LLFIFTNDTQMKALNHKFKSKNRATDVLAFDLAENKARNHINGEVYVSLQTAACQASNYQIDYNEEVARLCIHGFLHLLGYDDQKPVDKKKMWQIQENMLNLK